MIEKTDETHSSWRCGFHITPPEGWLNDPNGLCQFRGVYHVFHQYSPAWPEPHAPRGWGHATSTDLVHWEHRGMVITPDTPDEASGSYSGSAVVVRGAAADGGDLLRLYYTGNVKQPGDYDYIRTGRKAAQILVESDDGLALGEKRVLMRNPDYPPLCSCHVRDPKVWWQDGSWHMVLGARDLFDKGLALLYRSDDGLAWDFSALVHSAAPFGFMWECPDRIELDGSEFLSICPQGLASLPWANGMRDQSGYIPLGEGERLIDAPVVDQTRFTRWDCGFDFYAPQTFVDESGRTILIGWMGMPEAPFDSAPDGLGWIHCLTVPRLLERTPDGAIVQAPVPELAALRGAELPSERDGVLVAPGHRADLVFSGIEDAFEVVLDGALRLSFAEGELTLSFLDADRGDAGVGAGRRARSCALGQMRDLRVLVDGSAVEAFADGGRAALATRWFPREEHLTVSVRGTCADTRAWEMGDGMESGFNL